MGTENTNTEGTQQTNPAATEGETPAAANPDVQTGTAPVAVEGQGNAGDAGGDAGKHGAEDKGGDAGDGDGQTGDDLPLTGAPEAYADITLPEGFVLEGERKDAALELFRSLDLSQAGAQKAIDHFINTVAADEAVRAQAMEAAIAQQRDDWGKQARAELGDQYDAKVNLARTAVQAIGSEKLVAAFDELGWGNHPELIKAFATFGATMRDTPIDGIGTGGNDIPAKKDPWNQMYPDM